MASVANNLPSGLAPLVYVMGPSGAGKDSILRFARINLGAADNIAFAHRYITRAPDMSGENHVALTREEFELRRAAGLFVYHWQAHDILYGIGTEIDAWRQAGITVVMNGSRQHYATLRDQTASVVPVLVTASPDILAARLAHRGRESKAAVLARLQRETEQPHGVATHVIDNSGPLEAAGLRFVVLLRRLARETAEP